MEELIQIPWLFPRNVGHCIELFPCYFTWHFSPL